VPTTKLALLIAVLCSELSHQLSHHSTSAAQDNLAPTRHEKIKGSREGSKVVRAEGSEPPRKALIGAIDEPPRSRQLFVSQCEMSRGRVRGCEVRTGRWRASRSA